MAIEVLPPQLANQIAAGEVVERPASVVKELVENSIDAGASRINIDIEKGGAKLIRISDDGNGIVKEQLALALSRHATSKLHSLHDLDAIMSFGFRGEALASISSVARLTLTSKTAEQSEAWQAHAEGSQMAVKVNPAAHPVGTTIDVVDLFFNVPARRRFLKSDKTEFTHIDEWLKRIAVALPHVHFTLQHNGKVVRNYRPANTDIQFIQRLGQITSRQFAEQALRIECQHSDLKLSGYVQNPLQIDSNTNILDVHYFYVNGRLVRDRLVNHAVRQAFASEGQTEAKLPSYVLMLELEPGQVDVNVHPAKHEVRFHQARYVHDYILQALQSVVIEANELPLSTSPQHQLADSHSDGVEASTNNDIPLSQAPLNIDRQQYVGEPMSSYTEAPALRQSRSTSTTSAQPYTPQQRPSQAIANYQQLVTNAQACVEVEHTEVSHQPIIPMPAIVAGKWWVMVADDTISMLSIIRANESVIEHKISQKFATGLVAQPLLMPVSLNLEEDWISTLSEREAILRQMGIELSCRQQQLIIKKVPPYLRNAPLATVIPELLQWLRFEVPSELAITKWLAKHSVAGFTHAGEVWREFISMPAAQQQTLIAGATALPWQNWLKEQSSDKR